MPQNAANLETAPFGVPVANASGSALTSVTLNDGQVLIGSTGNAPVAATLTAGSNVTITNGPGSIEIAAAAGGTGDVVWTEIKTVVFTSSGTYNPPAGLQFIMIEAVGASGRVPAIAGSSAIELRAGGAGGGYCRAIRSAAQIGASAAVTIGAPASSQTGGNTTFVDSTGTLNATGGNEGNRLADVARLSAAGTRQTGAQTHPAGWVISSNPRGGGSPCIFYEGATLVKGLLSGGGPSTLGVGAPYSFILGPAGVNQTFPSSAPAGKGAGFSAQASRRVSGTQSLPEETGSPGVVYITEFIV